MTSLPARVRMPIIEKGFRNVRQDLARRSLGEWKLIRAKIMLIIVLRRESSMADIRVEAFLFAVPYGCCYPELRRRVTGAEKSRAIMQNRKS